MSYDPPICCVEGCSNISNHTDVKYFGTLYENMCDFHYEQVKDILDDPNRPKCLKVDCHKLAHKSNGNSGLPTWHKYCYVHHQERYYKNRPKGDSADLSAFMTEEPKRKPKFKRKNYGDLLPFIS